MTYLRLATLALALAIAACGRGGDAESPRLQPEGAAAQGGDAVQAAETTAAGETIFSFSDNTAQFAISSEIDPAIATFDPALAALIWRETQKEINTFAAQAIEDEKLVAEEAAANGGENWFRPYELQIDHKVTAVSADVISIEKNVFTETGGAHPNSFMAGSIYTRTSPERVALGTIVADLPAYREAVIAGLIEKKMSAGWDVSDRPQIEGEVRDTLLDEPTGMAPFAMVSNIVLEPSDVPGKFGGITVLYSPYDVGSYAEGPYTVTVASAALQPMLAPEWKDRLGGNPPPRDF